VIATETGVDAEDFLETVGEPRGGQRVRGEPTAEIGEAPSDRRESDADQGRSRQRASHAEARPRVARCCVVDRHFYASLTD